MTVSAAQPTHPWLIQGGMGIAVSGWRLASTVARAGQLGVVSGTGIDNVFVRRLQDEGADEDLRRVLGHFPVPRMVDEVLSRFATVRRRPREPYRTLPMLTRDSPAASWDVLVLAAFAEVAMAKAGHGGLVGINLLTKVQLPTAATLFGALLAGVDYVIMGAGVPTHIPGLLARLSRGEAVEEPLTVATATGERTDTVPFDPAPYAPATSLATPRFIAVVSSHVLATALARRSNGPVHGFVVERPSAGGHNAPPRGRMEIDEHGNPIYGDRDRIDLDALGELGRPYWIAGGVTSREQVRDAIDHGAAGVQVGTLFAYCRESGMSAALRERILAALTHGPLEVRTSTTASSTGYPFKVVVTPDTVADEGVYRARRRHCDLGYLREAYELPDGTIGYRCAAEPVASFLRKGGERARTVGTTCLCNGLMATAGLGQFRSGGRQEPPIVTSGDALDQVVTLLAGRSSYGALDVIEHLRPAALV